MSFYTHKKSSYYYMCIEYFLNVELYIYQYQYKIFCLKQNEDMTKLPKRLAVAEFI